MARSAVSCRVLCLGLLLTLCACNADEGDDDHAPNVDDDASDDDNGGDDDDNDNDVSPPDEEPPINPFLADSPWPMGHANSYCQDSSPLRGPEAADDLAVDFLPGTPVSVFLPYGNANGEGERPVWASTIFHIYTIDASQSPLERGAMIGKEVDVSNLISGAYTLVDRDGVFYAPQGPRLFAYANQDPDDLHSPIVQQAVYELDDAQPDESIIGLNMTYDGVLALATSAGRVGVVARNFSSSQFSRPGDQDEGLSNSIAVDEDGGVYVVTTKKMRRVQWTGEELTLDEAQGAWVADYEHGPDTPQPGRLSVGSGTTPTLMGVGDGDKFVAICDGAQVMNIVLFWRDEIPADWQPIAPGKDRRIAAEVPVDFGDPQAENTSTEQSLVVRGYEAVVVNNYYGPHAISGVMAPALSNLPPFAPYGAQKFTWDPATRELTAAWANPDISCPNGVPCMSRGSGLFYCIGQRESLWTLEAVDWATGAPAFHVLLGDEFKYNSFWAGVEIGPDRNIITGAVFGTLDIRPR